MLEVVTDVSQAVNGLSGMSRRLVDLRPAWRKIERDLELSHRRHFAQLGGRYVLTGDLRASLTSNATGAVREAHRGELVFGSSLPHAKYQRRRGKSAVLVLTPLVLSRAAGHVVDHVVNG
jgi:hypothetical protein